MSFASSIFTCVYLILKQSRYYLDIYWYLYRINLFIWKLLCCAVLNNRLNTAQRAYHREDVFVKKKIRFNNCLWNVLGILQPSILWPGFRYFDFSLNFSSTELYFKFICSKCCFWFRVEQNTCSNWMLLGN